MRSTGSQFLDKGRPRDLLKEPLHKSWETTHPEYKPAKDNDRTANRALLFKRKFI
jgi:hypothetical protein